MKTLEAISGAWKIEESPVGHRYGSPNTHWLIVEDRVMVIQDSIASNNVFHMKIWAEPAMMAENAIALSGRCGGAGFAKVDGDFLFISIGKDGKSLPCFAPDCGCFFSFTRDHSIQLPIIESPTHEVFTHPVLGRLEWNDLMQEWGGSVAINDETVCEIMLNDTLVPLEMQISKLLDFLDWLRPNLSNVIRACAERVREWVVPEDQDIESLPLEKIANTICIDSVSWGMHDISLWASTSLPIDHSLRVFVEADNNRFRLIGVAVEG